MTSFRYSYDDPGNEEFRALFFWYKGGFSPLYVKVLQVQGISTSCISVHQEQTQQALGHQVFLEGILQQRNMMEPLRCITFIRGGMIRKRGGLWRGQKTLFLKNTLMDIAKTLRLFIQMPWG